MLNDLMIRWAKIAYAHPWKIVLVALLISIAGGYLTTKLSINSDFAMLLPEDAQSVKDLKAISKRMGALGTLIVQIQGDDFKAMKRLVDDLVVRLKAYPPSQIRFIDYKVNEHKKFFNKNKFLYVKIKELEKFKQELKKRIATEKMKATGFFVDLEEEEEGEDSPGEKNLEMSKWKEKYREKIEVFDKYRDGYLTDREGKTILVVIKTPGTATGVDFAKQIVTKIKKEISALNPTSYHQSIKVYYTGGLQTLIEEYYALRDDILVVSNICVGLVLLAVTIYYRSIRMTGILCMGLLAGLLSTFGLTFLKIGYLTASTAFLASIVAGNGINFGIYFLARYMEERRYGRPVQETLSITLIGVVRSVSTAALAAGTSYLSLMFENFRGFSEFGFIGGAGMFICLIFALTLNPALVVLMERHWPFKQITREAGEKGRIFSFAVAWICQRFSRPIFAVGILLSLVSLVALVFFLRDPFEYSYKKLRNQYSRQKGSGALDTQSESILGERSSPHVILADHLDQVRPMKKALEKYKEDVANPEHRVINNIKTVFDYLPGDKDAQKTKLALLMEIREYILKNKFDFLSPEDKKTLEDLTPPADLRQVRIEDLPKEIVRQFTEENGRRGTPLLVYMADDMSVWNGHDLKKFADVVREVKIPAQKDDAKVKTIRSSGHAVIFSDMLKYVADGAPKATLLAFILVSLVILLSYRSLGHVLILVAAMSLGVLLQMGVAIMLQQKINFLNFIAIPIQFGIGVDYSVNLYSRYLEEGRGSIIHSLCNTGGAVMITSLTTIIGYSALWLSLNGAINTFGTLANIGEFTCLFVAIFILPCFLILFRGGMKK